MADEIDFRFERETIVETGQAMIERELTTGTGGKY